MLPDPAVRTGVCSPAALYSSSTISCRFSRAWEATAEMPTVLFVRRLSSPAACAAHSSTCSSVTKGFPARLSISISAVAAASPD